MLFFPYSLSTFLISPSLFFKSLGEKVVHRPAPQGRCHSRPAPPAGGGPPPPRRARRPLEERLARPGDWPASGRGLFRERLGIGQTPRVRGRRELPSLPTGDGRYRAARRHPCGFRTPGLSCSITLRPRPARRPCVAEAALRGATAPAHLRRDRRLPVWCSRWRVLWMKGQSRAVPPRPACHGPHPSLPGMSRRRGSQRPRVLEVARGPNWTGQPGNWQMCHSDHRKGTEKAPACCLHGGHHRTKLNLVVWLFNQIAILIYHCFESALSFLPEPPRAAQHVGSACLPCPPLATGVEQQPGHTSQGALSFPGLGPGPHGDLGQSELCLGHRAGA